MKVQMFLDVVIRDKEGKVVKRLRKKCHSYVRQMIDGLKVQFSYTATSMKNTAGSTKSVIPYADNFRVDAGSGVSDFGVQVGTGTNSVTISDYCLQTKIAHGTGAGQLQYGATSIGTVAIVGSTAQFTVARTFTNVSGADITVNEVGLVGAFIDSGTSYYLLERSLLTFSVGNGLSATVTYTIKVTV